MAQINSRLVLLLSFFNLRFLLYRVFFFFLNDPFVLLEYEISILITWEVSTNLSIVKFSTQEKDFKFFTEFFFFRICLYSYFFTKEDMEFFLSVKLNFHGALKKTSGHVGSGILDVAYHTAFIFLGSDDKVIGVNWRLGIRVMSGKRQLHVGRATGLMSFSLFSFSSFPPLCLGIRSRVTS